MKHSVLDMNACHVVADNFCKTQIVQGDTLLSLKSTVCLVLKADGTLRVALKDAKR